MKLKKLLICSIGLSLLLGGCMNMDKKVEDEQTTKNVDTETGSTDNEELNQNQHERDLYMSVQDYTGEEYETPTYNEKIDKFAEENRLVVEKAVKNYFSEEYKTEVIVHNIVGAQDGAAVIVESVGEPHFYTEAIIPIDLSEEEILEDEVWSQKGQVEDAIITGLLAMIFEEKYRVLENYLEEAVNKYPVTGITQDALEKVSASGYSTTLYYTDWYQPLSSELYNTYIENPNMTKDEWEENFSNFEYDSNLLGITIDLYMNEENQSPDEKIFESIVSDIEGLQGVPKGAYAVIINDNRINKTSGIGTKENSIILRDFELIIKE
ncbi:DUF1672 family protein [Bacillus carboniphilus]|uniref:DUF1672 family protein n=1 Tax=Bacillus carboniphilus TaxID=86663 RepID=A0ABY9JRT3_9BACI|nr:DUF1672 family protein [Bacillus carboniphilus]WLR41519.1 DUF1672 family protein [Bacillus carboniphilus]